MAMSKTLTFEQLIKLREAAHSLMLGTVFYKEFEEYGIDLCDYAYKLDRLYDIAINTKFPE